MEVEGWRVAVWDDLSVVMLVMVVLAAKNQSRFIVQAWFLFSSDGLLLKLGNLRFLSILRF